MRRAPAAVVADILTMSRFGIALVMIPIAWTLHLGAVSVLVSLAWATDFLDGRLARAAGVIGRMGRWDLTADTAVGVGLLIGLAGARRVPVGVAIVVIVGLGAWFLMGNFAASLLLQLAGYLPLLAILWARRSSGWWLPFVTAITIGVADWRRLLTVNIPRFIHSLSGRPANHPAGNNHQ